MEIRVVEEQVHRDGVFHRDLHDGIGVEYLDDVALCRNFQFLHDLENIVANLLFRVAIYHREARLFLNFVGKLIIRDINRYDFERGEGKLKDVIYLAIFLLMIYSAVKIVPIYVSNYQLSDKIQEQARFAVVNRYTEEQIRDNVFKVVQELEIPAKRDVIKVFNTNAVVKISMEYTVPVDLFFYHTDLH